MFSHLLTKVSTLLSSLLITAPLLMTRVPGVTPESQRMVTTSPVSGVTVQTLVRDKRRGQAQHLTWPLMRSPASGPLLFLISRPGAAASATHTTPRVRASQEWMVSSTLCSTRRRNWSLMDPHCSGGSRFIFMTKVYQAKSVVRIIRIYQVNFGLDLKWQGLD